MKKLLSLGLVVGTISSCHTSFDNIKKDVKQATSKDKKPTSKTQADPKKDKKPTSKTQVVTKKEHTQGTFKLGVIGKDLRNDKKGKKIAQEVIKYSKSIEEKRVDLFLDKDDVEQNLGISSKSQGEEYINLPQRLFFNTSKNYL